jgi:hypothetical protein
MPPLPGIFPDMMAPVVRNDNDSRRMQIMRWGMLTPPQFIKAGAIDRGVTNIRNVNSAHWRAWLKPDAARLGQSLQPVGDDDAFAMNVDGSGLVFLDNDTAEIDADTGVNAVFDCGGGIALGQAALQCDCALDGVNHARKLGQQTIAHKLKDVAVMGGDLRFEEFLTVGAQPCERAGLILLHEPAVADHIDSDNGGEAAFHAVAPSRRRLTHRHSRIYLGGGTVGILYGRIWHYSVMAP